MRVPARWLGGLAWGVGLAGAAVLLTIGPRLGQPSAGAGRTLVTIWSWDIAQKSLASLVPSFEKEHPDIVVRVLLSGASENVESRFLLALTAGVGAPTVQHLQERDGARFTPTGRLFDLTPYAAKYAHDFPEAVWNSCTHDGHVYGIPWDLAPCAVYYKRWLFKRYGVDPAKINTWDDFIAAGEQILKRSGGKTRMLPLSPADLGNTFLMFMCENRGNLFDKQGRIVLDSRANREVLTLLRRMMDTGINAPIQGIGADWEATLGGDKVACYPAPVWQMKQIKDYSAGTAGKWGVFRMPAFGRGGLRVCVWGGSILVIPKQGHAQRAGWKFIAYTNCTVAGQVHQFREYGLFPAFLPALKNPIFDAPDPFFAGQHVNRLFATDVTKIPVMNSSPYWQQATTFLNQNLNRWASQRLDNEAFLREVADDLGRQLHLPVVNEGATRLPAVSAAEPSSAQPAAEKTAP